MSTTDFNSKTRTEQILKVMNVLTWIAFIGFLIEAGTILFSFGVSYFNPEGARDYYKGEDLHALREHSLWYYAQVMSILFTISAMKAYVFYLLIKVFLKINLADPFTMDVALKLEKISYVLFGISVFGMMGKGHARWLVDITGDHYSIAFTGEFLFMAGLVFVISQIFKRGVEMQIENELTV